MADKAMAMMIAPGEDVDRSWIPLTASNVWRWLPRPPLTTWSARLPYPHPRYPSPARQEAREAILKQWRDPSWCVGLWFYVDVRLIDWRTGQVRLPSGYVLAGHVMNGPPLKMSDLCVICFRRPTEYSRTGAACCTEHADA